MSLSAKDATRAQILVVEDSSVFREMQGLLLGQAGYAVSSHENPQAALEVAARQAFDLVVIDYELPEMNGQQFMHALRKLQPEIAVIFVSGSLTLDLAIQLSSQGVAGIFNKPANPKTLLEKINETLEQQAVRDTAARVGSASPLPTPRRGTTRAPFVAAPTSNIEPAADRLAYAPRFVLGASGRFRDFTHQLWKVRDFRAALWLQGEAGSPFELIAREMAEISIFRDGPIMVCPAKKFDPRNLIEVLAPSLLSHDAGTLVVTEVETFTAEQQKTLENLMTGRDVFLPFARRFRLVLSGTGALSDRVDDGSFGETLYYKITSLSITVPSLREMRGDIVTNARRILATYHEDGHEHSPLALAPDAATWIESHQWPGNYEELTRTITAAAETVHGSELTFDAINAVRSVEERSSEKPAPFAESLPFIEATDAPIGETRPPFPIQSDLAATPEPSRVQALASAPVSPAGRPAPAATSAGAVGRAPAGELFTRPTAPVQPLTAQSLFRPASSGYSFSQRLTESLANVDSCTMH